MLELFEKDIKFSLNGKPKVANRNTKGKMGLVAIVVDWCGHCKNMKPEFKASANMLEGKDLFFATLDGDKNQETVSKLGVSSFPTVFFIDKNGEFKEVYQGGRTKYNFNNYMCTMTRVCKL